MLFGFAALVALGFGAWAQAVSGGASAQATQTSTEKTADSRQVTAVQLPARISPAVPRGSEGTDQPRYATMNPPPADETAGAATPPAAAPTAKVTVAPADTGQGAPPAPPRYSTGVAPRVDERIMVAGLRPSEDSMYRLGPGDKLRVTIFNETDLSGDFTIDGQGYVRLPLVGQVQAAGLTSFGLESRIAESFVSGGYLLNPRVAVEITNYRPFYIIGEVSKPGEYAYVNAMSVPNAIALAGGYTDRAVDSTVLVRHMGDKKEREVPADETTRIYPGDVVRVERTTYWAIMTLLSPLISPFSAVAYLLK